MNYHNITKDDMLNGDGLRVVLWVSGCSLNCKNCQNPQTHSKDSGILFDKEAEDELFEALSKPWISGLTLSGGHPLEQYNQETLLNLCIKMKQLLPTKTIWLYTGLLWENIKHLEIIKFIDVLCDGPFVEALKDTRAHWVGSTNQRVIDVQESLRLDEVVLHN